MYVVVHVHLYVYMCNHAVSAYSGKSVHIMSSALSRVQSVMGSNPTRGSTFFFGKVTDCLGCAVLLCFIFCMTLLASFFLPSSSLINMYMNMCMLEDQKTGSQNFISISTMRLKSYLQENAIH